MRLSRIAIILLIIVAVGGGLAVFRHTRGGEEGGVLRVANQKGSTRATMEAAGVLKDAPYRVEWSEFPAAQTLLEAVAGGAADLGLAGDAPFIFAYQSGAPIKAVGALAPVRRSRGALAIVVSKASHAHGIGDLVGKTVATTRGSIGHYLLLQALERAHLPPGAVKLSFLSPADAKAAFDSGAIDGWATWSPYLSVAETQGARVIVDAADYDQTLGFDVANDAVIGPKKALIRDFLAREAKALDWARAHPDDFARVLARDTGLPLEIARATFDRNNRQSVPIDAGVIAHEQAVADRFQRAGLAPPTRPIAGAFDPVPGKGLFAPQTVALSH